jgi:uncharacterized protein YutE (UPF0331/DUF86 family)
MGDHFAKLMPDYSFLNPIDALSAYAHEYSRVKLVEELATLLHIADIQPGPAHISFAKLLFDKIITTNFDFLLEKAYDKNGRANRPIVDEEQLSIRDRISDPKKDTEILSVLKLHGDLHHPNRLVVTEEDYDIFLHKYPLLSTYVSYLLMSRTPLFIGYSLDDPDFRQIWQIIGNRLGQLRRRGYAILVNPSKLDQAKYERRGIKVIGIPGNKKDYGTILSTLFIEIGDYWSEKSAYKSIVTGIENQAEFYLPKDSQTRLCYFALPVDMLSYYKTNIFPILEPYNFTPILSRDVTAPGSILAKVAAIIDRATIIVADITSSEVTSELKLAIEKNKRILLIIEKGSEIPFEFEKFDKIVRPQFPELPDNDFTNEIESYFSKIRNDDVDLYKSEPMRLYEKKEYNAAIISVISLLENDLKDILKEKIAVGDIEQRDFYHRGIRRWIDLAVKHEIIDYQEANKLLEYINIRNMLVHTKGVKSESKQAINIIKFVLEITGRKK